MPASGFKSMPKQAFFSSPFKNKNGNSSGYHMAKMPCPESTPLGNSPPLWLAVQGLGWRQRDAQSAQFVLLLHAGCQRHTSFRDLQSHGFCYLNHPKEQTHKTNGESPQCHCSGNVTAQGRSEQHTHAPGHGDRIPKVATRREAGKTCPCKSHQTISF